MLANRIRLQLCTRLAQRYSTVHIPTRDGWHLQAHRIGPPSNESGPPVVLIPGHANTSWVFFGTKKGGIASALALAGRDVWALDVRGTDELTKEEKNKPVRIFDKLAVDLPTVLEHIRRETGWDEVDAVGHSVGGILLYLHALEERAAGLGRVVAIASPLKWSHKTLPSPLRGRTAQYLAGRLGRVPLSSAVKLVASKADARLMPTHFDPKSFEASGFRDFLRWGVSDVYGDELAEILSWMDGADPRSVFTDNHLDKREERLDVPVLFLVGAADSVVPPESVLDAYLSLGGPTRAYVVAGRDHGFEHDYRHTDILLGPDVDEEVAPCIVTWLNTEKICSHWADRLHGTVGEPQSHAA